MQLINKITRMTLSLESFRIGIRIQIVEARLFVLQHAVLRSCIAAILFLVFCYYAFNGLAWGMRHDTFNDDRVRQYERNMDAQSVDELARPHHPN